VTSDTTSQTSGEPVPGVGEVELPKASIAPLVVMLGISLIAAGTMLGPAMIIVGAVLFIVALVMWVANLFPGRGHSAVPVEAAAGPAIHATSGTVERIPGLPPGTRVQLPAVVHPTSAGVKGGLLGALVMPIPAVIYSLSTGHGLWYPANLLVGMVLPGVDKLAVSDLEKFNFGYLMAAIVIHLAMSLVIGLAYGVLLPMLPRIPKELAWGALLMPVLWTGASFVAITVVDPSLARRLDWPSFIFAQFVFGTFAAVIVRRLAWLGRLGAGVLGGVVGGTMMAAVAIGWGAATGNGIWYPINLLVALVRPDVANLPNAELTTFHESWLLTAAAMHAALSLTFAVLLALTAPRLPDIPGPVAWGALLMPVLWTAYSYGLMDVVNPLLARQVDWPWFVASQFVFGVAASIVVARSEKVPLGPVGHNRIGRVEDAGIGEARIPNP
jgi:hypothetical protein